MSLETMTKLATTTVGVGGSTTVTFSNIPQGYTDLKILISARNTAMNYGGFYMRLNSSSSGYTQRRIKGEGSTASSDTSIEIPLEQSNWTASVFGNAEISISNYAGSTYKSASIDAVTENNGTDNRNTLGAWLWSNSSPVTSISFGTFDTGASDSFAQHSTFTLYGIKNAAKTAGNSIKATGGNIVFDGTYVTHTFLSSGTFTPTQPLIADYLVVAGGGGGGGYIGAGGGAGGLRCTVGATGGGGSLESALSLTTGTGYVVTIGAGGTGGTRSTYDATQGGNSSFSNIISIGGGFGAGGGAASGGAGGSGGGGGYTAAPGTGTTNQGFAGGTRVGNDNDAANGGGGAGAAGAGYIASPGGSGGAGGIGIQTNISGTNTYYAGGGGGGFANSGGAIGPGGLGGGGIGGYGAGGGAGITYPTAGTPNTGGGGGGAGYNSGDSNANGKNGGSGIVIIRYKG